jgi:hypothetical protein
MGKRRGLRLCRSGADRSDRPNRRHAASRIVGANIFRRRLQLSVNDSPITPRSLNLNPLDTDNCSIEQRLVALPVQMQANTCALYPDLAVASPVRRNM